MVRICTLVFLSGLLGFATVSHSADEEAVVEKRLPIGAELNLGTNVGAGTVFPSTYNQGSFVATSLYAYPYYKTEKFWGEREFKLHGEASTAFEWLGKGNPFPGQINNKFSFGDVKVRAELKKALYAKDAGLSLATAFELEAPVSKSARTANRIIGLGGFLNAAWSKYGVTLSYKPVAIAYIHSTPFKSDACSADAVDSDKLSNGDCLVAGRQTMVTLKNTVQLGYEFGNNSLTLAFRTYHNFLRRPGSGEKTELKASSNITESTLSFLEYAYNFPTEIPTSIILGLSGYQAPYDASGSFRVPFFNFTEPEKNETEAYVQLNVTI